MDSSEKLETTEATCLRTADRVDYAELNEQEKSQILTLQQSILESMLQDNSPLQIINNLCRLEEQLLPNSVSSVMLYDSTRKKLDVLAAPSIPPEARKQFSDLQPGPGSGSCGNVIYQQTPIFVSNTLADSRWLDLRHLAQAFNLMACWSMPIRGEGGRIVGTFALSSFEARAPSTFHRKLLEIGASIVGIVLDRREQIESRRLYSHIFDSSGESIVITDRSQVILSVNPTFTRMFGYPAEEVIGRPPGFLKSGRHGASYYQKMWTELHQNGYWQDEIWNRRMDGTIHPYLLGISLVRDADGAIVHYVGIYSDIGRYKQAQAQIEYLAYHDSLTQLPNRLLVRDRAELAILTARDSATNLALLMIDIDHFKNINDSLGHRTGDQLILEISHRLQRCLRDTDTLSRHGGDEFLIVLPLMPDNDPITQLLDNIMDSMAAPFQLGDSEITASLSIGVAVYPNDGQDFDTLLKAADIAMYRAKDSGRNAWRFYTEQMNDDAQNRITLCNGLRQALSHQQFHLHYQPQINLTDGMIVGAEALLRWQHPVLGNIPPNRFIPVAEDNGIIIQIGEWVLNEACRQLVQWQHAGLPRFRMAVNLSAIQFTRSDLVASVKRALEQSGLDAELLELELTESILMHNSEQILATVKQLKALGVQLSIDDFGTGYSSLSYLKRFNVDKLKIDQSFVYDMVNNTSDTAIVRAIIQMAKGLNLTTIAEGVEHAEQLSLLLDEQCDEAQGYHIARPLPPDEFLAWCKRQPCCGT